MRLFAVVPAGGRSERMGRPKLSLPLGSHTVLQQVLQVLAQGGVEQSLVVIGPHTPELLPLARQAGAAICQLSQPTSDMRTTVEAGLAWLEQHEQPDPEDAWFLVPADHPSLVPEVIQQLRAEYHFGDRRIMVIPTFEGKRGHPVLIAWSHLQGIRAHPSGFGLNTYLRQHSDQVREIAVAFPQILWDLDTPEDYQRLVQAMNDGICKAWPCS